MTTEQEIGTKDLIYEDKDISSLSAAISVYVTAFSKPPFNETWEVIEGDMNPNNLSDLDHFISDVLREPENLDIEELADGTQNTKFGDLIVKTYYPLNKIIEPYALALDNAETLLVLKDTSGNVYVLSDGQRINPSIEPQAVARFVNYSNEQIPDLMNEISPYLRQREDLMKIVNELSDRERILYLGEIVNLNDNLIQQGSFTRQTLELYKKKYEDNLPDTVIYLTKPGTGVERKGDREKLNNRFTCALIEKNYPKGTQFEHKRFEFNSHADDSTIIYISKIS